VRQYGPAMSARLLPVLVAMTVAASGCAGGEEPEMTAVPLPTVTASPSPEVTETLSSAEVPAEAAAETPEGAASFIRFFFSQLEVAYAIANPDLVASLSAPGCVTCDNYVGSLTALREDAGSVRDYSIRVESVEPSGVDEETLTAVVTLNIGEYVRRDAENRVTGREESALGVVQDVRLVLAEDNWLVGEISQ
jgi:hypothetical protein